MNYTNQSSDLVSSNNEQVEIAEPPYWSVSIYIAMNVVIMVLALIGNLIILVVELFNKEKTSTDWLVLFMSVYDLLMAGIGAPLDILMHTGSWISVGSNFLCGALMYLQETLSYSSTLLLTVTAVDRYIKTCRPLVAGITSRRSVGICTTVTVFTSLFCLPILWYYVYDEDRKCKYDIAGGATMVFSVLMVCIQGTFLVMFVAVVVSYSMVAYTIRARRNVFKTNILKSENQSPASLRPLTDANARKSLLTGRLRCKNKIAPASSTALEVGPIKVLSEKSTARQSSIQMQISEIDAHSNGSQMANTEDVKEHETMFSTNGQLISIIDHLNATPDPARQSRHINLNPGQSNPVNRNNTKEAQMNKTTAIMFAVTSVFILSWLPPWLQWVVWPKGYSSSDQGSMGIMFCRRIFVVNTCTNPLFFIGMSSKFRNTMKKTFGKLSMRLQQSMGTSWSP